MEAAALCRLWGILLTWGAELGSFRVLCAVGAVTNSRRQLCQNEQSHPPQLLLCLQLLFKNNSQIFPGLFHSGSMLLGDLFSLQRSVTHFGAACDQLQVHLSRAWFILLWGVAPSEESFPFVSTQAKQECRKSQIGNKTAALPQQPPTAAHTFGLFRLF